MKYLRCSYCKLKVESTHIGKFTCNQCATEPGFEYSFHGKWSKEEKGIMETAIQHELNMLNIKNYGRKTL